MIVFNREFPSLDWRYNVYRTCLKNVPVGSLFFYKGCPFELEGFTSDSIYVCRSYDVEDYFILLDGWYQVSALLLDFPNNKDIYDFKEKHIDVCPF